jgi:hypothetical protein
VVKRQATLRLPLLILLILFNLALIGILTWAVHQILVGTGVAVV